MSLPTLVFDQTNLASSRWVRLLFGREFDFQDMISMWDLLFSEKLSLNIIDLVCVVMLLRIRQPCKLFLVVEAVNESR